MMVCSKLVTANFQFYFECSIQLFFILSASKTNNCRLYPLTIEGNSRKRLIFGNVYTLVQLIDMTIKNYRLVKLMLNLQFGGTTSPGHQVSVRMRKAYYSSSIPGELYLSSFSYFFRLAMQFQFSGSSAVGKINLWQKACFQLTIIDMGTVIFLNLKIWDLPSCWKFYWICCNCGTLRCRKDSLNMMINLPINKVSACVGCWVKSWIFSPKGDVQ
jgi:hypothetical protein